MNKYNNFTVEETNLLSIYMTGSKEGLVVAMNAAAALYGGGNAGLCRPYPCQSGAHDRSGVCGACPLPPTRYERH